MPFQGSFKRIKSELREQLSSGERAFWYGMVVLVLVLPALAIGVLIFGGNDLRGPGVGLLFVTIVVYAVPVSPIVQGRARRREARDRQDR